MRLVDWLIGWLAMEYMHACACLKQHQQHWLATVLGIPLTSNSMAQPCMCASPSLSLQVLAAAGPASLVLLDELGSGTDPGEGAALARAVLDVLAKRAPLTLATTHHAELRQVASSNNNSSHASSSNGSSGTAADGLGGSFGEGSAAAAAGQYQAVSMEFDPLSLRPTYRLLWGVAGASNALDIAQVLGFDG